MESIEQQLTRKGIDVEVLKARSRKRIKKVEKVKMNELNKKPPQKGFKPPYPVFNPLLNLKPNSSHFFLFDKKPKLFFDL